MKTLPETVLITKTNHMSYLNQLKTHRESLEITVQQCDNDIENTLKCIEHNQKNIELLRDQKLVLAKQICLINESIAEEEKNAND